MDRKGKKQDHKHMDRVPQRNDFSLQSKVHETNLDKINSSQIGDRVSVRRIIDRVVQTAGPTLFTIVDGTGSFTLKGFESPGERAFPNIDLGDAIQTTIHRWKAIFRIMKKKQG